MENALIYHTKKFSIAQCDTTNSFHLNVEDDTIELKVCHLLALKNRINQIDIVDFLQAEGPSVEVIFLCEQQRVLALDVLQLIELKELITGAFVMLELNSILHEKIYRVV